MKTEISLKKLIAKTRNTRDYENLKSRLGKELGTLLYKIVDEADRADKELDIVHGCITDLYNITESKTATEVLFEHGIEMTDNDTFNCQLLNAMERYAESKAALQNKVSDVSAEKILDKHYEPKMHWKSVNREKVLKAMHEYASIVNERKDNVGVKGEEVSFQKSVNEWMQVCFGEQISVDGIERNHRFLEEALELVQSLDCTKDEAHQLVDYVFNRPIGEPYQELGGVMVTLAALSNAWKLSMDNCGETELKRIWTKLEQIREKQANKPKHSPLPQSQPQQKEVEDWQDLAYKELPITIQDAAVKQFLLWLESNNFLITHK